MYLESADHISVIFWIIFLRTNILFCCLNNEDPAARESAQNQSDDQSCQNLRNYGYLLQANAKTRANKALHSPSNCWSYSLDRG